MKTKLLLFFLTLGFTTVSCGQEKKEVLMNIDGQPVYASEFKRVYKKNLELVKDESQKSVASYLDLFIDYKLKVVEAYSEGLENNSAFKNDFDKYEEQIFREYVFEDKVKEDIIKEAYERGKEEVEVSHILIKVGYTASSQDTLAAYNKIKNIRDEALAGKDFSSLVEQYTEEPGGKERRGYLGYFSSFRMVYPFESMAYNTPVGEVSNIVRTQFGYHLLKVTDRRERLPVIKVSHIMIATKGDSTDVQSKNKIDEIYELLNQGSSFESLAKQFSTDKGSAVNGGELKPFRKGELRAPKFEEAAYGLKTKGEISNPIKSVFGWHIIKFDSLVDNPSFSEQKKELEAKVQSGERSKIVTNALTENIKSKFNYKKGEEYLEFFENYIGDSLLKKLAILPEFPLNSNKLLFTIGDREIRFKDFDTYLKKERLGIKKIGSKSATLMNAYDQFETISLKRFYKDYLEETNEAYAAMVGEYRDGLLIFDVMDRNVWSKAKKDTLGLRNYYETHKKEHMWQERVNATILSSSSKEDAEYVKNALNSGKSIEEIKETLSKQDKVMITTEGLFEIDSTQLPEGFNAKVGTSDILKHEESFVVVVVNNLMPPSIKEFDSVKGRIINGYQNQLEKQWVQSLRDKYSVEINDKVFKKIKNELK